MQHSFMLVHAAELAVGEQWLPTYIQGHRSLDDHGWVSISSGALALSDHDGVSSVSMQALPFSPSLPAYL